MGSIFLLSLCIYSLAFRALLASSTAAQPRGRIKDELLRLSDLPRKSGYWRGLRAQMERIDSQGPRALYYIEEKKKQFARSLRSQLSLLKTLAAAAPLLGLLGTLVGMIDTFEALSGERSGDTASVVAGGISKALLTTNAGLIVAIPAILIAYFARGKFEQALHVFSALENSLRTSDSTPR